MEHFPLHSFYPNKFGISVNVFGSGNNSNHVVITEPLIKCTR